MFNLLHFYLAFRLALSAYGLAILLQIFLYGRPTPEGSRFVEHWQDYFGYVALYEAAGFFLPSLPFFFLWAFLRKKLLQGSVWIFIHKIHLLLLTFLLFLTQMDHELKRFVGVRLSWSFLQTYVHFNTSSDIVYDSLAGDLGGPFIGLFLFLFIPTMYYIWGFKNLTQCYQTKTWLQSRQKFVWFFILLASVFPLVYRSVTGGKFRLYKVQSLVLSMGQDLYGALTDTEAPEDLPELVARYQKQWFERNNSKSWHFPDPQFPYIREPFNRPLPRAFDSVSWNVIVLQLETFRAWNMGLMRPDLLRSPTPFLDGFAQSENGAYWSRFRSLAPPTVNGLLASHCSVFPHSTRYVSTSFPYVQLDSLPEVLRRHGYQTEIFTGSDPDVDNSRRWILQWYNKLWFYRDAKESDREVFRQAASRILELGRSKQPFMATVVSISNHYPFRTREAALNIAGEDSAAERIQNTMRYTDDAVREFVGRLENEPWFERTVVVVMGDHGYNLGEHGERPALFTMQAESTWVPLIVYGSHPRIPKGRHDEVASLLDVAPTIADLLGIRERTAWLGDSLLEKKTHSVMGFAREKLAFADTPDWSLVMDAMTGMPRVYHRMSDPLQKHPLTSPDPTDIANLFSRIEEQRRLNDFLIVTDRIWKPE